MKRQTRICYTETQKALMWDHWQKGETLCSIARLFDRGHSAVGRIISQTGGIRPPERKRFIKLREKNIESRRLTPCSPAV